MRTDILAALAVLVTAVACGNGVECVAPVQVGCLGNAACEALVQGSHDEAARAAPCGIHLLLIDYPDCPE